MGKIENCFGSKEVADLYGLSAFEQPILRLSITELQSSPNVLDIRALAGIVVTPDVIEPEHDTITDPAIRIQPVSNAYGIVDKNPKRAKEATHSVNVLDEAHSLLIRNPMRDDSELETGVKDLVKQRDGAITISRVMPIRTVMRNLDRQRHMDPHAMIIYDVAKLALNNIW